MKLVLVPKTEAVGPMVTGGVVVTVVVVVVDPPGGRDSEDIKLIRRLAILKSRIAIGMTPQTVTDALVTNQRAGTHFAKYA